MSCRGSSVVISSVQLLGPHCTCLRNSYSVSFNQSSTSLNLGELGGDVCLLGVPQGRASVPWGPWHDVPTKEHVQTDTCRLVTSMWL